MDDTSVCTPLPAESDSQNNTTSTPNVASVTDADKVINTKIDSTQVEGEFCLEGCKFSFTASFLANWLTSSTVEWAN